VHLVCTPSLVAQCSLRDACLSYEEAISDSLLRKNAEQVDLAQV